MCIIVNTNEFEAFTFGQDMEKMKKSKAAIYVGEEGGWRYASVEVLRT